MKLFLKETGFDNLLSLSALNENGLAKIEAHLNKNRHVLDALKCCYADSYRKQEVFSLLPGHTLALLNIPHQIDQMNSAKKSMKQLAKEKSRKRSPEKSLDDLMTSLVALLNAYPAKKGIMYRTTSFQSIISLMWKQKGTMVVHPSNVVSCVRFAPKKFP